MSQWTKRSQKRKKKFSFGPQKPMKQACKSSEDAQAAGFARLEKVWAR